MGRTVDGIPHVGTVPGKQNQFIMAGFNGGGMSWIFLAGKAMASMIRDDVVFEETGLPSVFKATKERLKSALRDTSKV
jgi:glycine/D-amino acid oxidase-like deaminating enzyme